MMNTENNIQLLYQISSKEARLDLAIRQAERQLSNVNKKLQMLWYDLAISVAVAILPGLLYLLLHRSRFIPVVAICTALKGIYLMLLPLMIYQLARAVRMLRLNREDGAVYTEPDREGTLRGDRPDREPSYRAEQKKLITVLTRYYLNKDVIGQIRRQIAESDCCTMTSAELYYQLDSLPFYEEVGPALEVGRTAGAGSVRLLFPSMMIGLIYALRVWGVI